MRVSSSPAELFTLIRCLEVIQEIIHLSCELCKTQKSHL